MALPDFSMRQLLESGAHFGHRQQRWNPKMAPFIYGSRNDIHILDLTQTVPLLHQATPPGAIDSWQSWIGTDRKLEGPRFTSYMSMIHETIAGRGAALAGAGFADEHLRRGQLVRLTKASRRHAGSFHIVMRRNAGPMVKAVAQALLGSVGDS